MINTIFYTGLTNETKEYMHSLLDYLASVEEIPTNGAESYWVGYGSLVINGLTPKSDVDLLLITKSGDFKPYRVQEAYNNRPITVYVLTEKDLLADGNEQIYGGYFTGKLLSPFILHGGDAEVLEEIYSSVHSFVNRLSYAPVELDTAPGKLIRIYLTRYMQVCPWYKSYILKYIQTLGMQQAVHLLTKHYNRINETRANQDVINMNSDELHCHVLRLVARFWSYGAIEHQNNYKFSDYYFDKAEQTERTVDPDGLLWSDFKTRVGM